MQRPRSGLRNPDCHSKWSEGKLCTGLGLEREWSDACFRDIVLAWSKDELEGVRLEVGH